jgi:hypothetical protein
MKHERRKQEITSSLGLPSYRIVLIFEGRHTSRCRLADTCLCVCPSPSPGGCSAVFQSRQGHHAAHLACEKRQVRCSSYLSPAVGTGRDPIREQAGRSLANPGIVLHLVQHISPSILFPVSRKWPNARDCLEEALSKRTSRSFTDQ